MSSPVRGHVEAGASEALRASERRPLPPIGKHGLSERAIKRRNAKEWRKQMNKVKLLAEVAKGVVRWAQAHGWKRVAVGHRKDATSVYVHLARKLDERRICVRVSDHRHPRGVEGVSVDWILPEHQAAGVNWLREWLVRHSQPSNDVAGEAAQAVRSVPERSIGMSGFASVGEAGGELSNTPPSTLQIRRMDGS